MTILFSKSGSLYGKRRLPDIRQTLTGPGPILNARYPQLPALNPPSVDVQRQLPSQNTDDGIKTANWPFGTLTL